MGIQFKVTGTMYISWQLVNLIMRESEEIKLENEEKCCDSRATLLT
jgi:hypothetical protein